MQKGDDDSRRRAAVVQFFAFHQGTKGIPTAQIVQGNGKGTAMTHGSPQIFQAAVLTRKARAMETPAPGFLLQIRAAEVLLLGTAALCCHTEERRNSHLTKPD